MEEDEKFRTSYLDILSLVNKSESKNMLLKSKDNIERDYISLLSASQNKNKINLSVSSIQKSNIDTISENTKIKFKNPEKKSDENSNLQHTQDEDSDSSSSKSEKENNDVVDELYNQLNLKLVKRLSDNRHFKARMSSLEDKNNALKYINIQKKNSLLLQADPNYNKIVDLFSVNKNAERKKSFLRMGRNSLYVPKKNSLINPSLVVKFVKKSVEFTDYGKYYKYLKWFDFIIAILVLANIVISMIDNEIMLKENDKYISKIFMSHSHAGNFDIYRFSKTRTLTPEENLLRFINVIIVIVTSIGLFWRYMINVRLLKAENKLSINEGLWASGLLKYLILEIVICLIVYPPFLNDVVYGTMLGISYAYYWNSLICALVSLKVYNVLKIYSHISEWTSETARSICNKHNVQPGVHFSIKAELKNRPYQVLSISMVIFTIYFGYLFRIFEYYVSADPTIIMKGQNKLQFLANAMWLCVVTMTTVGFGDYFPQSHLGRFIGVVSCMIGLLLVSLIVVSLGQISAFDNQEEKAYYIIKKLSAVDNAVEKAKNVIIIFLRLRLTLNERAKYKLSNRFVIITQLKKEISRFKNDYKLATTYTVPDDELLKMIRNNLKLNMSTLCVNMKKLDGLDGKLNRISENQAKCLEKMEEIEDRQKRIGDFLVQVNNDYFNSRMNHFYYKSDDKKENSLSCYTASGGFELKKDKNNNIKTDKQIRDIIFSPGEQNENDF